MRNFIVFLLILGVIGFMVKSHKSGQDGDDSGPITNPVYAEIRLKAEGGDRSVTMVAIGKGRDDADCKRMLSDLPSRVGDHRKADGTPFWTVESSGCKQSLDARSAKLFDDKPTFVTYVSAAPGADAPDERETRMIFWGVTVRESDMVCNEITNFRGHWKGAINCIHAMASE